MSTKVHNLSLNLNRYLNINYDFLANNTIMCIDNNKKNVMAIYRVILYNCFLIIY